MDELNVVDPNPLPKTDNVDDKPYKRPTSSKFWTILRSVQRYSSYSFTAFATMHAASVIITPAFSLDAANSTLNFTKAVYQEWYLEPLLVYAPLTLHIASGALLRFHANYLHRQHYLRWPTVSKVWHKMSLVSRSGIFITPLVLMHMYSMRIAPLNVLGDSSAISLEYVAHWFHNSPVMMWAVYPVMVGATVFHMTMGWRKWLGAPGKKTAYSIIGGLTSLALVAMIRIARMPKATGWMAKQFNQVLASMSLF